jgi:putative ABC transport system permease protein
MNPIATLRVAVRALLRNKMRSFLTTLGIIIGIAAVIAMVAIGEGAKTKVEEAFASMGTNLLIVMPGSTMTGGAHGGFGSMPTLTWDDVHAIQNEVSSVRYVAPQLRTNIQVVSEEQNWGTQVNGTTPEYFLIRSWKTSHGDLFTQSDVDGGTKVVVLGQTVVDKLWGPNANPVGQMVRINNVPFNVMGVLDRKGQSPMGQDYDDGVFVPWTTYESKIKSGLKKYLNGILCVGATSPQTTSVAETQISNLLRDRHHIGPGAEDDFSVRNLTEMASAQAQGTQTMTTLLFFIALVSLVVGGIGIMNIMLVSVTERTREIGVRMAVGAKPKNILAQFLVEAITLSLMGGLLGVALGVSVAGALARSFHWAMIIRPDIVVVSVASSAAVGILFGLYPAQKASRLDPIEALRYE